MAVKWRMRSAGIIRQILLVSGELRSSLLGGLGLILDKSFGGASQQPVSRRSECPGASVRRDSPLGPDLFQVYS